MQIPDNTACGKTYLQMLRYADGGAYSHVFIRELMRSSSCDSFSNLQSLRDSYSNFLGAECLERIMQFKQNCRDLDKAQQAVAHYGHWTERTLLKALPWYDYLYLHSIDKSERLLEQVFRNTNYSSGGKTIVRNTSEYLAKKKHKLEEHIRTEEKQ